MNDRVKYALVIFLFIILNAGCSFLFVKLLIPVPASATFVFSNKNITGDPRLLSYFLREEAGGESPASRGILTPLDGMRRVASLRPILHEDGLGGFFVEEVPAYLIESSRYLFSERLIPDLVAAVQFLYDQSLRKKEKEEKNDL